MGHITDKAYTCPECKVPLVLQEHGFWKCPACSGEWWPEDEPLEKQVREAYREDSGRWYIPVKKKGSRSSGSRRFKKKKKYPRTLVERYYTE